MSYGARNEVVGFRTYDERNVANRSFDTARDGTLRNFSPDQVAREVYASFLRRPRPYQELLTEAKSKYLVTREIVAGLVEPIMHASEVHSNAEKAQRIWCAMPYDGDPDFVRALLLRDPEALKVLYVEKLGKPLPRITWTERNVFPGVTLAVPQRTAQVEAAPQVVIPRPSEQVSRQPLRTVTAEPAARFPVQTVRRVSPPNRGSHPFNHENAKEGKKVPVTASSEESRNIHLDTTSLLKPAEGGRTLPPTYEMTRDLRPIPRQEEKERFHKGRRQQSYQPPTTSWGRPPLHLAPLAEHEVVALPTKSESEGPRSITIYEPGNPLQHFTVEEVGRLDHIDVYLAMRTVLHGLRNAETMSDVIAAMGVTNPDEFKGKLVARVKKYGEARDALKDDPDLALDFADRMRALTLDKDSTVRLMSDCTDGRDIIRMLRQLKPDQIVRLFPQTIEL